MVSIVSFGVIMLEEPTIVANSKGAMILPMLPKPFEAPMIVIRNLVGQASAN